MKKTLILLTAFCLLSCGSVKKHIDKEETEIKTESNSVLDYEKSSYTLEPVNLDRPILVGGKEYINTKLTIIKDKGTETKKEATEVKQETEDTNIERDNTELFRGIAREFFILLAILFLINLAYKHFTKHKNIL